MSSNVVVPFLSSLVSNVHYDLLQTHHDTDGRYLPQQLGKGRFAKVFKANQRCVGRNIRRVAIKVLHDHADYSAERLFQQEIEMLRDLGFGGSVNTVTMLDIVELAPMVMCGGCGSLYHPKCPQCSQHLLQRKAPQEELPTHPSLHCSGCGWELSAKDVQRYDHQLYSPRTKTCCTASAGTVISFVDREAVVMELVEAPGDRTQNPIIKFYEHRRQAFNDMRAQYNMRPSASRKTSSAWASAHSFLRPANAENLLAKAQLLEKVELMLQLAEAVSWLHTEQRIVHKDLAPDNVLLRMRGDETGEERWRLDPIRNLRDRIRNLATPKRFELKVIDFGLADKESLTRSWYEEEDVKAVWIKRPYISPEAQSRKEPINGLEFLSDPPRVKVPSALVRTELSMMATDILADVSDSSRDYDVEIQGVEEQPPGSGNYYAFFRGTAPSSPQNRQFELVRRLGEPHDIYAVGGLFYYILTGDEKAVELLKALVDLLQKRPCELTAAAIRGRNREDYQNLCEAIPEPFCRDELMLVILRAMVRGQEQSFVKSRIERGPRPAQNLLAEVTRIYQNIQRDVLDAERIQRLRYTVFTLSGFLAASTGYGMWTLLHRLLGH